MSSVVLIVPTPMTASSRAFDWEMAFTSLWGSTSSPLGRWGSTIAGSFKDGCWQCIPLPGIILTNEAQCKLLPEVFDDKLASAGSDGAVMLHQCEGIHDAAVEEKPEYIFVEFL